MKRAHAPVDTSAPQEESDPVWATFPSGQGDRIAGETLLAGYRVVRRLASTSRADVYLGHSSHAGDAPVALKIFRPDADPESIEREVRTLCDSRPGRFVHLIDVATLPDARVCLVLERLNPQSLGRLLQDRKTLAPGEVVSILAPIVTTLSYLHEHGLAHGALDSGNVLLHPSGRPVVAGLGSLHELPASPSAKISLLREDYDRLAALLDDVLGHLDSACDAAATQGATRLMADFRSAARCSPFRPALGELERSLFEWNVAAPLKINLTGPAVTHVQPAALPRGAEPVAVDRRGRHSLPTAQAMRTPDVSPVNGWTWDDLEGTRRGGEPRSAGPNVVEAAQGLPRRLIARLLRTVRPTGRGARAGVLELAKRQALVALSTRLVQSLRARRRPLSIAALIAASALVGALTLLPPGGQASRGQIAAPAAPLPEGVDLPDPAAPLAIADDPVRAVPGLLTQRSACLEAASVVCLDTVDQSGSAAMTADSYDARQAQQGAAVGPIPSYESWVATLVERTGNMALVSLTPPESMDQHKPASVLVVKGEAGWRVREIFTY
ncbi:hypothetical protein GY21_17380 [Cryobacterium roopkundense]|uniref:Protein kinase domain-containing protein n=1 Tax=Cryobacterium roopkundense TaxID=1001240 RepID=A0A099J256_9MICO|nr:protein kinase [Cryobacterium roopkundense]KGJ72130.1 hypothetical protein GY21_17380 [Cryobacterium roopkundense]MBB5641171.1 hypothetical protein [Cryobacterium roopkundense]